MTGMSSAGECGCGRSCENPGKHPLSRHGVHDATTDPVLIGEWWRRSPGANVGIATGAASGLIVEAGETAFVEMVATYGGAERGRRNQAWWDAHRTELARAVASR